MREAGKCGYLATRSKDYKIKGGDMEKGRFLRDSQIVVLGLCIVAATIAGSVILSQGFLKVMKFTNEVITVTGSVQEKIKSDYIIWRGCITRREVDLKLAYTNLQADLGKLKIYLGKKGIKKEDLIILQTNTEIVYKKNEKGNDTNDIQGYKLMQLVEVRSNDVDKIAQLARESTEIIDAGIQFESAQPEYYYTKLDALKIEMLGKATANAKKRAESMAKASGSRVGLMRAARMGVFQITPENSTEVSDYGENDTTSLMKKVTAVVAASFELK